jgi:DNA-binding transcriptional LysR family regulator
MFDLTHARGFVAVAEELHFGRAAARLNLTQSPLSRQIQALEQALGVELLQRTSRSVRLTEAGRAFLAEAYRVLEAAEAAERQTRRVARGEAGLVRIGFTSAAVYRALPLVVARLRAELPEVDLVLQEMVTADQLEVLAARRIDLGLLRPPAGLPAEAADIAFSVLLRERLLLAVPRAHSLATGGRPELRDLDGQDFITWTPRGGSYFLDLLGALFRGAGVAPRPRQRVDGMHAMLALVGAGIGVALVPEAARTIRMANVILRPIRLPANVAAELSLAWRRSDDAPASLAARKVVLGLFPTRP